MNLILFEPGEVSEADMVRVTGARATHLRQVLGVSVGQSVTVGVVNGPSGRATVRSIETDAVVLDCRLDGPIPPVPPIDILLALPRPKVLKRLWAQLAALGVGRIMLTNAERVEPSYFDSHVLQPQTYRPLLLEGLQQARDTRLPVVSVHRRFRVLIEDDLQALVGDAVRVAAEPGDGPSPLDVVRGAAGQRVLLAIGPEGGWNSFELALLAMHGFQTVTLGDRVLRTDTAVIALMAVVQAALATRSSPS